MPDLNMERFQIRTDLALEAHEMAVEEQREKTGEESSSAVTDVVVKEETVEGVKITTVEIGEEGAKRLNKRAGHYLTFEAQGIRKKTRPSKTTSNASLQKSLLLFYAIKELKTRTLV